jgi:lycopene cyclase domain-containing protein
MWHLAFSALLLVGGLAGQWYYRVELFDSWGRFLRVFALFFAICFVWDCIGVHNDYWHYYPSDNRTGIKLWIIPIEGTTFYTIGPYAFLVLYHIWR